MSRRLIQGKTLCILVAIYFGNCSGIHNADNQTEALKVLVKCCPLNYVLAVPDGQPPVCALNAHPTDLSSPPSPEFLFEGHRITYFPGTSQVERSPDERTVEPVTASCSSMAKLYRNDNGVWFKVDELSGRLAVGLDYFIQGAWIPVSKQNNSYCLDYTEDSLTTPTRNGDSAIQSHPTLVLCSLDEDTLAEFVTHRYVYGVASIVTCLPIFLTLGIWGFLGIHRNRRKWVLISYFTSYAIACLVHGIQILIYTNSLDQDAPSPSLGCKMFYHMLLYFACVFGTACMFVSLDIFFCFHKMASSLGVPTPSLKQAVLVFLATWVLPLIVYSLSEVLRDLLDPSPPDFAWRRCITRNFNLLQATQTIQFIFKMAVYLSTSGIIYKIKKSTELAKAQAANDFNESVTLYLKLFVTTGMPFSFLGLDYMLAEQNPMAHHWFLLRFPHAFIGFYIFFVFGLSLDVRNKWKSYFQTRRESTFSGTKLTGTST